jgi:hypothetical protein
LLWIFSSVLSLDAQEIKTKKIIGTVTAKKKYSIEVVTHEGYENVVLPTSTPIFQQLDRPEWNWEQQLIHLKLLASATDGDPQHDYRLELPIPNPLYVVGRFAHQAEYERLWNRPQKAVVRYLLTSQESPPEVPLSGEQLLRGKVIGVSDQDIVVVQAGTETLKVKLGDREAKIEGFTMTKLEPHAVTVDIDAHWIDGQWVAQEVNFRQQIDRKPLETGELPRLLLLGDELTLAMHRPLCEQLAGKFNIYHPPENCRGYGNWARIGCWVGDYRTEGRQWDAIVFTTGLTDTQQSTSQYSDNLDKWITSLESTNARLMWLPVTSRNSEDRTNVDQLNRTARSVIAKHPSTIIIPVDTANAPQKSGVEELQWRAEQISKFLLSDSSQ